MDATRVAIAEDGALLRDGMARLLAGSGVLVVGVCTTAEELQALVGDRSPDVAILDVRLPPTHTDEGLTAALELRAQHPDVGVLVLSQYVEVGLAMRLLADSATRAGYLLKDRISEVPEFLTVIARIAAGGTAVDRTIVADLLAQRRNRDLLASLGPRERAVLELVAQGRSTSEIAKGMHATVARAEGDVVRVADALGLPSGNGHADRVLGVLRRLRG